MIIWGDEGSNTTKETNLIGWFKANAGAFAPPAADAFADNSEGDLAVAALRTAQTGGRPPVAPIPRDGPIPPYTTCTL